MFFLGIPFSPLDLPQATLEVLSGRLKGKMIVTPNVDHVVRFHSDATFKGVYEQADLYLNDSKVLRALSTLVGRALPSVVPGSDLTANILAQGQGTGLKICLMGASAETAENVFSQFPGFGWTHHYPPMGFINSEMEVRECVRIAVDSNSDLCFVAVGSPQQEILGRKILEGGFEGVVLCVGASFLFLSGEEKRAPLILRRFGLEWLFRFLSNPRRLFSRYFIRCPQIFVILLKSLFISSGTSGRG